MELEARNAPEAYSELLHRLRLGCIEEISRNGPVYSFPEPVLLKVRVPEERIVFSPIRRANHVFHTIEFIWMMAGFCHVEHLLPYNKRYSEFAEKDGNVHGAYGHRWRVSFGVDQIMTNLEILKREPNTRRAVLGMWNPHSDLGKSKRDVPCNTHIYFRQYLGKLDMTVCNRSNDLIWGMMGANIVHMTLLHEFMARSLGLDVGTYYVMTNNMHFYQDLYPNGNEIWYQDIVQVGHDYYREEGLETYPVLSKKEESTDFLKACKLFFHDPTHPSLTDVPWFCDVALPLRHIWHIIKAGGTPTEKELETIKAKDIKKGVEIWLSTRK